MATRMLDRLGGEQACMRLAGEFYGRVGKDPSLKRLFPGKSLRCATEEFAAFLVQFLGGDEQETQKRWWLSLKESHARFAISAAERSAWLGHMRATLEAPWIEGAVAAALGRFFLHSSAYVIGKGTGKAEEAELDARWDEQLALDAAVEAIIGGADEEAIALARRFASRPGVFVGLLARMVQTGRTKLVSYVLEQAAGFVGVRHAGRTLLHFAAGAGSVAVVDALLRAGALADELDRGGHTALYSVANECPGDGGPLVVRRLVEAGADVNFQGGVTRATALHMAARRGHVAIARTLIACGAFAGLRDSKGVTPLGRALNCRRKEVAELLSSLR